MALLQEPRVMQAEISSVKGYMVTYKQIGLKHILSRAYVCIYIYIGYV